MNGLPFHPGVSGNFLTAIPNIPVKQNLSMFPPATGEEPPPYFYILRLHYNIHRKQNLVSE